MHYNPNDWDNDPSPYVDPGTIATFALLLVALWLLLGLVY